MCWLDCIDCQFLQATTTKFLVSTINPTRRQMSVIFSRIE